MLIISKFDKISKNLIGCLCYHCMQGLFFILKFQLDLIINGEEGDISSFRRHPEWEVHGKQLVRQLFDV